jgi:hypothetical protein
VGCRIESEKWIAIYRRGHHLHPEDALTLLKRSLAALHPERSCHRNRPLDDEKLQ